MTVFALATLGDKTKNRNNPIFCRAAQEQLLVTVAGVIALDFANVNTALQDDETWAEFSTLDVGVFVCAMKYNSTYYKPMQEKNCLELPQMPN